MTRDRTDFPSQLHFEPTRAEALHRLDLFLPGSGRAYANDRNDDPGPERRGATSLLSPYLRRRMITEREIAAAVLDGEGFHRAEKFIQELCWRTYWKGWLELRPGIWDSFLSERDRLRDGLGSGAARALAQAEAGTTGIEGFDDWARELVETGWMHNHARMWFSSIWIFTLRLPWQLGADFFLRHLVDADPASNTLSWRWTAGLQTRGKTYLATAGNIARYTGGRFQPQCLASRAEALDEPSLPKPRDLPPMQELPSDDALLLVTDEDLSPLDNEIEGARPFAATLLATTVDVGQHGARGETATAFARGALADAAERLGTDKRHGPVRAIDGLDAEVIIDAAVAAGVGLVVTPYAPVGVTASALHTLRGELAAAGIALVQPRRQWDNAFWPHATRGYFALRQHIPDVLATEGLPVG